MFIGHYGVALALKKAEPKISLGWLFAAVQFVDILWSLFIVFGIERVQFHKGFMPATPFEFEYYPYTHSLVAGILWAGVGYIAVRYLPILKQVNKSRAALVIAFAVLSHWFLDLIVHAPDLPLGFDGHKVGFGLWNSLAATFAVEYLFFLGGLFIYLKTTKPDGNKGKYGIYILSAFLLVMYTLTTLSSDPPPSVTAGGIMGFILLVGLAVAGGGVDRRRAAA